MSGKSYVLQVKITPAERKKLELVALAAYLPLATWARTVLLKHADEALAPPSSRAKLPSDGRKR